MSNEIIPLSESDIIPQASDMAAYAKEAAEAEVAGGSFISFRGGVLRAGDAIIKGNAADVVVLDAVFENKHYAALFDPDVPAIPDCFAFSRNEGDLAPHAASAHLHCDTCSTCLQNQFGTGTKSDGSPSKGKACKNVRRLALLAWHGVQTPADVVAGEIFHAELPVGSCRGWGTYVKALSATMRLPIFGVVSKLALVPDARYSYLVRFGEPRSVPEALQPAIMLRRQEARQNIMFPYKVRELSAQKAPAPVASVEDAPHKKTKKF